MGSSMPPAGRPRFHALPYVNEVLVAFDSLLSSHIPNDNGYIDLCNGQSVNPFQRQGNFPRKQPALPQHDTSSVFLLDFW